MSSHWNARQAGVQLVKVSRIILIGGGGGGGGVYIEIMVPRFTRKTRITGKTTEIPERPKNNRETLIGALAKSFID